MKFNIYRDLTNEVYSVKFTFAEYGSDEVTAEAEEKLIQDHGPTVANVGGKIVGKYVDGKISRGKLEDDEDGIPFEFVQNPLKVELKDGMEFNYSISADSIIMTDKMKEVFDNKAQVAEQFAELFVLEMKYRLEVAVIIWHRLQSDFDVINPEEFTV
jgi:hypothetical protein